MYFPPKTALFSHSQHIEWLNFHREQLHPHSAKRKSTIVFYDLKQQFHIRSKSVMIFIGHRLKVHSLYKQPGSSMDVVKVGIFLLEEI